MGNRKRGLFKKFFISRTDGRSGPGKKHDGCDYFVLDLTHDPFAAPALAAYADACRAEYPLLAADLDAKHAAERGESAVPPNQEGEQALPEGAEQTYQPPQPVEDTP